MRFRVNFDSKICRFYCRTNGKWPNREKRYLKIGRFYCAARRIWRKRVEKRVQNGSNPYKTNGKPPNEVSWEYFLYEVFFCIYKKVSLLGVLGPSEVRGGFLLRFRIFQILGSESKGGGLLECGPRDAGSLVSTKYPQKIFRRASRAGLLHFPMFCCFWVPNTPFSARFARRIASFSYVFAAFGPRTSKKTPGTLRAPDCLIFLLFCLFSIPNAQKIPARFARRIASFP